MKITNKVLVDLDGNPIKSGDLELTVANVLVNCALLPAASGQGYAAKEVASRYEAAIALTKLEDDFWASKSGQKMIRDGVDRCFPEFVARVPGGMLKEVGLKRHYKLPEPIKMLRAKAATK